MKALFKFLIITLISVMALIGTAFASPINVEDINVQKVNGEFVVLVTLDNLNPVAGDHSKLSFSIEELGTEKDMGFYVVDTNDTQVLQFSLSEITDSYDSLKLGNDYIVTASTDGNSMSTAFLFGSEKTTDGLDLIFDSVRVDGVEVSTLSDLQVMNGDSLRISLLFSALGNFDDSRIMVSLDGYEHSPIVGTTEIFSVVEGKQYQKSIMVNLPSDMVTQKNYKLRIYGANDLSGLTYKEFEVYIDTERHRIDVLDIVMTPSSGVEPGQNLIASVRMKNRGQKSQDSVKVIVSIDELGISESSYVSNLNTNEVATSDDMLLYVPESASAKSYPVKVTLAYNDGYTQTSESFSMNVLSPKLVEEQNLLVSMDNNIELKAGEENTFEIVIANPNDESKPISIASLDAAWADVEVSPSLAMVKGGDSKTFTVKIMPKEAISGEKDLVLTVKEGSKVVSDLKVSTYVEPAEEELNLINIILAVLLIIAIIILLSLVITIAKRRNDK
ncbi:MAG: hypothetical protein KC589_01655 [Nanoarchaeota archaeon]|nr:hypothetical protein [Nanoarchaeota archaeon]